MYNIHFFLITKPFRIENAIKVCAKKKYLLISSLLKVFKPYSSDRDLHRTTRRKAELLPKQRGRKGEHYLFECITNYCIFVSLYLYYVKHERLKLTIISQTLFCFFQ